MKKKIYVLVALVMVLSFSGCDTKFKMPFNLGGSKYEDATKEFMEAAKNAEVDKMKSLVDDEKAFEDYRPSLDDNADDKNKTDEKMIKSIVAYEDECAKKITYDILEKDDDKKTVKLKCKYVDSKEFIKTYMQEAIRAMAKISMNKKAKEEDTDKAFEQAYQNAKANVTDTFVEQEVNLEFVDKDDKAKIKEISKEFSKVLTANIEDAFKEAMGQGADTEPIQENKKDVKKNK